jgi:NADPH:quinone reductase-like Zn-dependent oxidoreductase
LSRLQLRPVVGLSALHILNSLASIESGTRLLINGATGGIGMFLIQLAKKKGAIVTAVTSSKGIVMAKKWGADEIVDYKTENIQATNQRYDAIVDLSGKLSFKQSKPLLNPGATFITTLPGLQTMARSFFNNLFSSTKYKVLVLKPTNDNLKGLAGLIEDGLDVVVEKEYPITAVNAAYEAVAQGGIVGKAVITV